MLDVRLVRSRLVAICPLLRQVDIGLNVDQAMQQSVQAPRAWVIDLTEQAQPSRDTLISQIVTARWGVLLALPDMRRSDDANPLRDLRLSVRNALQGWEMDDTTAAEVDSGSLLAGGATCWWMDVFRCQYIAKPIF